MHSLKSKSLKTQTSTQKSIDSLTNRKSMNASIISGKSGLYSKSNSNNNSNNDNLKACCTKCLKAMSHSINIIKAFIMRLIFSMHSFVAICIVYSINHELWCLVNVVGVVFLLIELFVTIIRRKGKEPKWFFPCFFIYICTMIPPIWFIELHRIENSKKSRNSTIVTSSSLNFDIIQSSLNELGLQPDDIISNATTVLPINVTHEAAAVTLEISLMLLVILGRWFLPKGSISRSTLSQLLLVYMSLASDIVDLLSLLNEAQVQESFIMVCTTLAIFSWSLFQFSLNLVVTRGRSFQGAAFEDLDDDESDEACDKSEFSNKSSMNSENTLTRWLSSCRCKKIDFLDSEIWSILITLMFQDGPFLALRLTAVINFNVRTFVTMFFTCKNAIILFLQIYRLIAIYYENDDKQNTNDLVNNFTVLALSDLERRSMVAAINPSQARGIPISKLDNNLVDSCYCKCDCHKKNLSPEFKRNNKTLL